MHSQFWCCIVIRLVDVSENVLIARRIEVALQACGMLSGRHMGTEEILNCHLAVTVKTVPCTSTYTRSAHNELAVIVARNMHHNKQKHCTALTLMAREV